MMFYVWSNEHRQWWNPYSQGYTSIIGKAGQYPEEEALKICERANWLPGGVINEVMVPTAETFEKLRDALLEARAQLEYLDERSPTGTTPAVLARINDVLN